MIGNDRVLGLIPARGGSKGLPGKNIRPLGGKPLIAWSIEAALASRYLDRVALSSDDDRIMDTARRCGCDVPFRRPPALATDQATTLDVTRHALEQMPGYDILVLLQPTSPLRLAADIDAALEHLLQHNANSCMSVCEPAESPFWALGLNDSGRLHPLFDPDLARRRRQELPAAYLPNGALFIARVEHFLATQNLVDTDTLGYLMPRERSLDIDDAFDFKLAQCLIKDQTP